MTDEATVEKKKTAAQQLRLDRESQMVLFQGASLGQLALIFAMDKRTVGSKIAGKVEPCGMRAGFPIYQVRDAAPYLVTPAGDIEEHIKNMHHDDLPPLLNKNFWLGQKEKLRYQMEAGEVVKTIDVLDMLARVFKSTSMTIQLMGDRVERETELSETQRSILGQEVDGVLVQLRKNLIEEFRDEEAEAALTEPETEIDADVLAFDREAFGV